MAVKGMGGVPFWTAKLDWMLLSRGVKVMQSSLGGMHASDHAWLCVDIAVPEGSAGGAGAA